MSIKWLVLLLLAFHFWSACASQSSSSMKPETRTLAAHIASFDYPTLIYGNTSLEPQSNQKALKEILRSSDASPRARFLAAELLRKSGELDLKDVNADALAEAYCQALLTCTSEGEFGLGLVGNVWGYLWFDGDPGMGQVLIDLDRASIPALRRLAAHNEVVLYEGSREATTGNALMPRAKDFAAYYLHRITSISTRPIQLGDRDFEARDAAIKQLLSEIKD
jgi:hypothetical protein